MSKQELTPWFVNGEKPWESGVYQVRSHGFKGFAHWDRTDGWGAGADTLSEAYADRYSGSLRDFFQARGRAWRGLAHPPKANP